MQPGHLPLSPRRCWSRSDAARSWRVRWARPRTSTAGADPGSVTHQEHEQDFHAQRGLPKRDRTSKLLQSDESIIEGRDSKCWILRRKTSLSRTGPAHAQSDGFGQCVAIELTRFRVRIVI